MSQKAIDVLCRGFGLGKNDAARRVEAMTPEEITELETRWAESPKPATPAADGSSSENSSE